MLPVRYAISLIKSSKQSRIPFLLAVMFKNADWRRLVFILPDLVWSAEDSQKEETAEKPHSCREQQIFLEESS